jgi:hypothetical protein
MNLARAPRFRFSPLVLALSASFGGAVCGQDTAPVQTADARQRYDIAPGPLTAALNRFAMAAGVELSFDPGLAQGKQSPGLSGEFSVVDGFAALLAGSGLRAARAGSGAWSLEVAPPSANATTLPAVQVVGEAASPFDPLPERGGLKADHQTSSTKTALPLRETPQSVSVITRESIERRQVDRKSVV